MGRRADRVEGRPGAARAGGGLRRRVQGTSLRWRLTAWIAVVMLFSTGITFVAVYRGTGAQLRSQIDSELRDNANGFSHALAYDDDHSPAQIAAVAGRYVRGQSFRSSSTLLYGIIPGIGPRTNRPELFATGAPDEGESAATQDQEDNASQQLINGPDGYSTVLLPDAGEMRLLKHTVRVPGAPPVRIGVGQPLLSVAHAQAGVARAFILAAIVTLVGALLAAYLIGTRVSRPLRRMAAVAAQVDAGDLHPRIRDAGSQGDEVRVLADAFNHMLDRLTDAFAGQRAFVADASHELRTPLTVIRGQLEVLAAQPDPPGEEVRRVERLVQAEIARIGRLVDDLLLLAKSEQGQFLQLEVIDLAPYVQELWDGMSLIAERSFELGAVPNGTLLADPDRLAQALRNLLANAVAHTAPEAGLVRLRVERGGAGRVRFVVEDNGPGIPPEQRERVFDRFHRTDTARDRASGGTGLGLAIVRAIAEAHLGHVAADEAPAGGARITLELPGFTPAREGPRGAADTAGALSGSVRRA